MGVNYIFYKNFQEQRNGLAVNTSTHVTLCAYNVITARGQGPLKVL